MEGRGSQYRRGMTGELAWSESDELRRLVPVLAAAVAVVAAVAEPSSGLGLILVAVPVAAFLCWAYLPNVPLGAVAVAVVVSVVVAQRSGQLEPLLFEASLLAFVVGRWARSLMAAAALGLLAAASPVLASVIQEPSDVAVGIWILGIAFPWVMARAVARQGRLAAQLEISRRDLAQQALLDERRQIARDVHDLVGHGLAAVMLQLTSARHVLRREPAAAEEALRSAEAVGRRSMQELRRTVALLRSDGDAGVAPPLPSAREIPALVDDAQAAGLTVELRMRGELGEIDPGVGLALYRIAQEALANAVRHAPRARTVLELETSPGWVRLLAETSGAPLADRREPEHAGYGLLGMRERASALGGQFAAGATAEGWRVSCRLPLQADGELSGAQREDA